MKWRRQYVAFYSTLCMEFVDAEANKRLFDMRYAYLPRFSKQLIL